jgi:carboxyl-terminal processing protease
MMKNMSSKTKKVYKVLSVVLISILIFSFTSAGKYDDSIINEVRQVLKTNYVDDLPDSTLNQPTVEGIIKEINKTDTHTEYFTAKQYGDFTNTVNQTYVGIGVSIEMVPEGVQVLTVFDPSPAKDADIKSGDVIMMADQHLLGGLSSDAAVALIKGPAGTKVNLRIKRGTELLNKLVPRRQINAPTITGQILDNHIGYIDISSFGADTATKFGEKLSELEAKNVDSYIIDVRNNGGGYLDTALNIAGYFVGNQVALITRSRAEGEQKLNAVAHNILINKKVTFLINQYSASASEVLSGVVRDYDKANFIGLKSYGKGSVQWPATLSNKDVLKLTIEKFFSPKDITIDKVGITPNIEIPNEVDSMRVAELIFDTPKTLKSDLGYMKINLKDNSVVLSLDRAEDPLFWQSYSQLINLAAKEGSVMLGTDKGWTTLTKENLADLPRMFYPNYKELVKKKTADLNSGLIINFDSSILKTSLNDKNIEMIDTLTGARVPVLISTPKEKSVTVTPKTALKKGKTYYVVVSPKVLKADNKPVGYGMINEIETTK